MRRRTLLLGGQTTLLGITLAFLIVPASALFLHAYGAGMLPYTYLTVAAAGVLVSYVMTRLQRRWSLGRLAMAALTTYAVVVALSWVALALAGTTWVTFALIVLFPLSIPTGFVLVGAQAVRLFDVRGLKANFPRIAAGFSLGFAIGGFSAGLLVHPLGGPVPLVGLSSVVAVGMMGVVAVTLRTYPDELLAVPSPAGRRAATKPRSHRAPVPSLSTAQRLGRRAVAAVLSDRLVLVVLGYQVLSAAVTQLVDFMVWERAAVNYPDPSRLAQFQGYFAGVLNVVSVLFVLLLASPLITRFGVRFGLLANPVGVLVALAATVVIGQVVGPVGFVFLAVVCTVQIIDISATDGLTRTSIAATYQAVPPDTRLRAQTVVEGAGVPLAIGFAGVLLILHNALGLDIRIVVLATAVLCLAWVLFAVLAHRLYGTHLARVLTARAWDPAALRLDDPAALAAVVRLRGSVDPSDRITALDALVDAGAPDLPQLLAQALDDPEPLVRAHALGSARLSRTAAQQWVVTDALAARLDDADVEVRTGAAALLAGGTSSHHERALSRWREALAAPDDAMRRAALTAVARFPSAVFVPDLLDLAPRPNPSPELADALAAVGPHLTAALTRVLSSPPLGSDPELDAERRLLVRAVGRSGDPAGQAVLLDHLQACGRDEVTLVAEALVSAPVGTARRQPAKGLVAALVRSEAQRLGAVLQCLEEVGRVASRDGAGLLILRDALLDDVARGRRNVGVLLRVAGPIDSSDSVIAALGGTDEAGRNTAIELVEVSIGRSLTPLVLTVLDPRLTEAQRLAALRGLVPVQPLHPDWLTDLALDPTGTWSDPWLRAASLRAAAGICPEDLARFGPAREDPDPVVSQTSAWLQARASVA